MFYRVSSAIRLVAALALTLVGATAPFGAPAAAAPRAAVLPFEMQIDLQMDGLDFYGLPPKPKKAEAERLELVRDTLIKLLEERGAYEVVDLSAHAAEIKRAAPFDRCNGCEVEFGKLAGADVTVLCVVHKASELMINMAIFVRDVKTGELTQTMLASILQNDDTGWLKAIRNLVNNRLAPLRDATSEPK